MRLALRFDGRAGGVLSIGAERGDDPDTRQDYWVGPAIEKLVRYGAPGGVAKLLPDVTTLLLVDSATWAPKKWPRFRRLIIGYMRRAGIPFLLAHIPENRVMPADWQELVRWSVGGGLMALFKPKA